MAWVISTWIRLVGRGRGLGSGCAHLRFPTNLCVLSGTAGLDDLHLVKRLNRGNETMVRGNGM